MKRLFTSSLTCHRSAVSFSAATASVLAAMLLSISFAAADEGTAPDLARCANQDLKLENVLSDSILSQELPAERYTAAAQLRVAARRACSAGRFDVAMNLYQRAAAEIGLHLGNTDPGHD